MSHKLLMGKLHYKYNKKFSLSQKTTTRAIFGLFSKLYKRLNDERTIERPLFNNNALMLAMKRCIVAPLTHIVWIKFDAGCIHPFGSLHQTIVLVNSSIVLWLSHKKTLLSSKAVLCGSGHSIPHTRLLCLIIAVLI